MARYDKRQGTIAFKCKNCGKNGSGFIGQKYCKDRSCRKFYAMVNCKGCGKEFLSTHQHKRFCRTTCRSDHNNYKNNYKSPWKALGIASATVGAMHELKVAYDLLLKGYEVFRAQSPSCSCDLLILDKGKPKRIEVRTGNYLNSGVLTYPEKKDGSNKYEIMAVVTQDKIYYLPKGSINE